MANKKSKKNAPNEYWETITALLVLALSVIGAYQVGSWISDSRFVQIALAVAWTLCFVWFAYGKSKTR